MFTIRFTACLDLLCDGLGEEPYFRVLLAELTSPPPPTPLDGPSPLTTPLSQPADVKEGVIGFSFFFSIYSTWVGRAVCLDDLFIRQEYRSEYYQCYLH